jgi:hypothetical protein
MGFHTMKMHGNAKLSEAQVIAIREAANTPCTCCGRLASGVELAEQFGITPVAIHFIVTGRNYTRVGGPLRHSLRAPRQPATPHPRNEA